MIVIVTAVVAVLSILIHFEALDAIWSAAIRGTGFARMRMIGVIVGLLIAHWLEILLFAGAYWISETAFAAGHFVSSRPFGAWDYLYFSAETYTSLGLGDVYPTGSLRLLAGSETLTGLILIGWSTSFTFLVMTRFWRQNRRFRGHQP